jgi:hypothetical protein
MKDITITLEESERQATLLALAHLAIERPGWMWMLSQIALKMDNRTANDEPELFTKFWQMHAQEQGSIVALNAVLRKLQS